MLLIKTYAKTKRKRWLMSTFNYPRMRDNVAEKLLARFGTTATLTKLVNTGTDWNPTQTATDYTVTVVKKTIQAKDRDGTLVQMDDEIFIVSTDTTVTPEMPDTMTIEGTTFQVINVKTLKPGPTTMLWYVQCRK